ncbi:hypothetical protein ACHQM5_010741 [Ranunculus cassubicifolius]
MECLGSLVAELAKCAGSSLGPQIGNVISYKKRNEDLSKRIVELLVMKENVDQMVTATTRKGDMIGEVVNNWLNKVNRVVNEVAQLNVEAGAINSCFKGWCCSRYRLGKKANKMNNKVTQLLDEGLNYVESAIPVAIQDMELTAMRDFEAFESTEIAMKEVMKALEDTQVSKIGVHGMGGIGKTTLMRKIGNEVKKERKFNVVVMVGVSQNQDIKRIQDEIAGDLSLSFGQEGVESRARRLMKRLLQEKTVLIILDDIWKGLDLAKVGIPWGEDHKGCKIVLTTRREAVCNSMDTQKNVELECLSEHDSWNLFRKNAGKEVDSPNLIKLAEDVAKQCKGLPVALVTLGRAMRGKDQSMWENVFQQLKESNFKHIEDMDVNVVGAIKLSYDFIPYEDTKSIFLFCCLFPEDHKIGMDELVRYMIGEGIIKETNIDRSRGALNTMVNYLISSHLLQKGGKGGFVMMHDVIRDVAINIATDERGFIVKAGRELEGWPEKEKSINCMRLSLMGNELIDLPEQPECPNLLTLVLSGCDKLKHIPDTFFKEMKNLVNLDLSHTPISSLPSSLMCLDNLRTLCLDGCSELQDASVIGVLNTLEVISLQKTSIVTLPLEDIINFPNKKLVLLGN